MAKLILFMARGEVTQTDLENLLQLDGQIARLQGLRDGIAAGVLARFTSGGTVEAGPRTVDIEEGYAGKVRRQKLVVR